mgnify:FL=1
MKIIGIFLVLAASIGLAWQVRCDLKNHLAFLYDFRKLLLDIENEITDSMQPMDLILTYRVSSRNEQLQKLCIQMGAALGKKETKNGEMLWRDCLLRQRKNLPLSQEELELFCKAGSAFFGSSRAGNESHFKHYMQRIDEQITEVRAQKQEKQKVYQTVSVMCGLILILLLI